MTPSASLRPSRAPDPASALCLCAGTASQPVVLGDSSQEEEAGASQAERSSDGFEADASEEERSSQSNTSSSSQSSFVDDADASTPESHASSSYESSFIDDEDASTPASAATSSEFTATSSGFEDGDSD